MIYTARKLKIYAEDDVIDVDKLRKTNIALHRLCVRNAEPIQRALGVNYGLYLYSEENKKKYVYGHLRKYYGRNINLSQLRKENKLLYDYIAEKGNVEYNLRKQGFKVYRDSFYTRDNFKEALEEISFSGQIDYKDVETNLRNKIRRRAIKEGTSIDVYIENLGFIVNR